MTALLGQIITGISNQPVVSSVSSKLKGIGFSAFSIFQKYVLEPTENYLIGDLRLGGNFLEREEEFESHSFGLLGSVASWKPQSKEEMARVLNELDSQPQARSPYKSAEILVGASHFLLAETSPSAITHRKELMRYLNPSKYASITANLWEESWGKYKDTIDVSSNIDFKNIAIKSIAKGLLGIDLSDTDCADITKLGMKFKKYAKLPFSANFLRFNSEFRRDQRNYHEFTEGLLKEVIQKIQHSKDEIGEGLLTSKIIEKLSMNPNCKNLHKDPELKSIFLNLLALDNLIIVVNQIGCLKDPALLDDLSKEIQKSDVTRGSSSIDSAILLDKNKMPLLESIYQKALYVFTGNPIVIRYIQKGMQCGGHKVSPRTYLFIEAPVLNDKNPRPFSEGRRSCPGRIVAETVLKTIIVAAVSSGYVTNQAAKERKRQEETARKYNKKLLENILNN